MTLVRNSIIIVSMIFWANNLFAQNATPGKPLPEWKEGFLDIHHINTGRGNAAYCQLPDGTTMLIDAGELSPLDNRTFTPRNAVIRPDSTKKPYEWLAHYIKKVNPDYAYLDYALITHFHDDHFGAWYPEAPHSKKGNYQLTGITGIAEYFSIKTLIDRGAPNYDYPYELKKEVKSIHYGEIEFGKTMQNYFAFIEANKKSGMNIRALSVGSRSQIRLLHQPHKFKNFYVQNVKANRWIWTGKDSSVKSYFPSPDENRLPDENSLSIAFTINYGPFVYYSGGDNPGMIFPGDAQRDMETPIAKAVGEVDVATMDHHGNRDAINEFFIKTLRPSVWIGQTWSSDHPGHEVLLRLRNKHIYKKPGDLFATNMLEANKNVIGPLIDQSYKSQQGHILVRVEPGGESYYMIVLDDTRSDLLVKSVFGPYTSKTLKNIDNDK